MERNEYPLGSTFEHEGSTVLVVEDNNELEEEGPCDYCYFNKLADGCIQHPCTDDFRKDRKNVYYRKQ